MRLPAPSYAVESVLGAAVIILAVVVFSPAPPSRPKPVAAKAPAPPPPPDAPFLRATPVPNALTEARLAMVTQHWGQQFGDRTEVWERLAERRKDVWAAHLAEFRAQTVGAFDATPGRQSPWADLARAALGVRAQMLAEWQLTGENYENRRIEDAGARAEALMAGCDDPLIRYWDAESATRGGAENPAAFRAAAEWLWGCSYPSTRRVQAVFAWLVAAQRLPEGHALRADVPACEARIWELFDAAVRRSELVVDEDLIELAGRWQLYRRDAGVPREQTLADLDRRIRRAGGRDYLRRTVRGAGFVSQAADARGSGFADTVPEGAWEVFRARMTDAREVLLDACEDDLDGYTAPTLLVSVCNGLGAARDEIDDAFDQALEANPDSRSACYMWLESRHPKWSGSPDGADYLAACWELALYPGDGWAQSAVLANLLANYPLHGPRAEGEFGSAGFYASDDGLCLAWTVCRALEKARPGMSYYVNLLARLACLGRRYDLARECFARVGGRFSRDVFSNQPEYDQFLRDAGLTP